MSDRLLADRRKGHVRKFSDYLVDLGTIMEQVVLPDCPPPIFALAHSMGASVVIRTCRDGSRWFERVVGTAPMIALPSRTAMKVGGPLARALRMLGTGTRYVPTRDADAVGREDFIGNPLTSDPVRFARNSAIVEEEPDISLGSPTVAWVDTAMRQMKQFAEPSYAGQIRQPMLLVAAGRDEVVSTAAIETFGSHLLAGRHLLVPGAKHEILQELDMYRDQFWAAFDAFVPGTPRF